MLSVCYGVRSLHRGRHHPRHDGLLGADSPGCTTDDSVSNQVTLACNPGSGNGTHAFIRCRDAGGLLHTRIGSPIGPDGGSSRAVCATGESGPA